MAGVVPVLVLLVIQGCFFSPNAPPPVEERDGAEAASGSGGAGGEPVSGGGGTSSAGPHCGDGVLQEATGEECDGSDVPVEGMSCSASCRLEFPGFRINEIYADGGKYFIEIGGPPNRPIVDTDGNPLRIVIANHQNAPGADYELVGAQTGDNGYYVLYCDFGANDPLVVDAESSSHQTNIISQMDPRGSVWLLWPGEEYETPADVEAAKQGAIDGICYGMDGEGCWCHGADGADCGVSVLMAGVSLARAPNGVDSNVCAIDMILSMSPTPGAPNPQPM